MGEWSVTITGLRPPRPAGQRAVPGRAEARSSTTPEFVPEPAQGAAGRQHDRHRPFFPVPGHAHLRGHLHYRIVDVSSIKELARRCTRGSLPARPRPATTGRSPIQDPSRSSATTGRGLRPPAGARHDTAKSSARVPGSLARPPSDRRGRPRSPHDGRNRTFSLRGRPVTLHRPWWV